ncbi:HMG box protein [Aspergillus homomorphus CBS 101889]|uniref:HMG box protein n=1 Tax=Aspergillus homomorphus (strain CBS 101889) TaxID=1450537 RepID=A0A395IEJ2_ASPHC|nr:HMG box protein [Aspergillus homomorphus CBS 101889]RAL17578.1 HMG box protein [Aspergillus homomorphus CBS 101889]
MSRKEDSKASDATITVNVDDFTRTRDNVIASLAQLAKAVTTVQEAYITHANTVLGRDPVPLLDLTHLTSGIAGALYGSGAREMSPGANDDQKKKRKRAPPDPNAPKRALTPFFLYMQHNRSVIAKDLGPNAKPKEVSDEGTRRWQEMGEPEKEIWKKLYADNLAEYRKKVVAYKAGLPYEDDLKAANQLHQGMETGEHSDDSEDEEEEEEDEEEEEEEESSPEPVREPTPPRSGKRRRSEGKPALTKETATPSAKKESPEKKKRTSARKEKEKEDEQPPASARKTASGDAKRTKKKRKSEVGNEE